MPKIHTLKVRFFKLEGRIIEVTSMVNQDTIAPKKTEKITKPLQDFIIVPHPSLKLQEPLKTKSRRTM